MIHGDQFDGIVRYAGGSRSWATGPTRGAAPQHRFNWGAASSACLLVAVGVPQAQGQERRQFIDDFEKAIARGRAGAVWTGWSAAISTTPRSATSTAFLYCNDGDWVESCTALVEDFDGRLRIVHWADEVTRERWGMLPYQNAPARLAAE